MTREEAIKIFSGIASLAKINTEPTMSVCNVKNEVFTEILQALLVSRPDPITGLVPCGCGGVAEQMDFHAAFFPYSKVECLECGIEIMRTGYTIAEAHDMAKMGWNTSRGYTAPHLPGAIGPDAGEMAPNGDEGATHE